MIRAFVGAMPRICHHPFRCRGWREGTCKEIISPQGESWRELISQGTAGEEAELVEIISRNGGAPIRE